MVTVIVVACFWLGFELGRWGVRALRRRRRWRRALGSLGDVDRAMAYRPRSTRGGQAP